VVNTNINQEREHVPSLTLRGHQFFIDIKQKLLSIGASKVGCGRLEDGGEQEKKK
jgi:hypothetical protein